jgi:solute carrier family 35 protein F5
VREYIAVVAFNRAMTVEPSPGLVSNSRFVGLFNTVLLLPLIPILDVLSIESFQLPTRRQDWLVCAVNMMITLSSDYLYVLAMLKTTPVGESSLFRFVSRSTQGAGTADVVIFGAVVTVGLSLTIPLAMLGDLVRGSTSSITVQSLGGAVLVLVGFGLMGNEGLEEKIEEVETETERAEVDVVVFDAEDADREYRGT